MVTSNSLFHLQILRKSKEKKLLSNNGSSSKPKLVISCLDSSPIFLKYKLLLSKLLKLVVPLKPKFKKDPKSNLLKHKKPNCSLLRENNKCKKFDPLLQPSFSRFKQKLFKTFRLISFMI